MSLETCCYGWDWAKKRIAVFFRRLGSETVRKRREENEKLPDKQHFLYRCKRLDVGVEEEIKEVHKARNVALKEHGRGIVFRAKVEQMEDDEKCSRYFFKKSYGAKKAFCTVVEVK